MTSVKVPQDIDLLPGLALVDSTELRYVPTGDALECALDGDCSIAYLIYADQEVPAALGWEREGLEASGFTAAVGKTLSLPQANGSLVVAVGLGAEEDADTDAFREAGAALARATRSRSGVCAIVPKRTGVEQVTAFVEGVFLARYRYTAFKTQDDVASPHLSLRRLTIVAGDPELGEEEANAALKRARAFARATIIARDLTNAPPAHLIPQTFVESAQRLAELYGFEVEVLGRDELAELGCGGIIGVNRGSLFEAQLVKLRYAPAGKEGEDADTLALVGKGITFDSGGLTLKPAISMFEMKMDMGGAAAVLGTFASLAEMDTPIPVKAWLPMTDNMISGNSMRIGEVLTTRKGLTVEVRNTDAEGRLILMEALTLAAESNPARIVDIATLTGAQMIALGTEIAAVMGNDPELIGRVERAGAVTGEKVWELPLEPRYMDMLDSTIADIANVGKRAAGSIVAGLFLSKFVEDVPWAHLDIAGPMSAEKDDRWLTSGATGFGARLLLELASASAN